MERYLFRHFLSTFARKMNGKMTSKSLFSSLVGVILAFASCGELKTESSLPSSVEEVPERETLYQVSLVQSLVMGDYDGSVSIEDVLKKGDCGIGTFDAANGEMVVLDGQCYRCGGDGSVETVSGEEKTPFCNVTFFDADVEGTLSSIANVKELEQGLHQLVQSAGYSMNHIYMVQIKGHFDQRLVRSEVAQKKDSEGKYLPLAEGLKDAERQFGYHHLSGRLVGLYCPTYMGQVNVPGWHFHFLSDDAQRGGHVISLVAKEGLKAVVDRTISFHMDLPKSASFDSFDFSADLDEKIRNVEKKE